MGHAYYEFQHVELAGVGNGKKRVRNPPGGHASNIFGPPEESTPQRSGRNRMTSTIHLGDTMDSPASSTTSSPPDTPLKSVSPNPVTGEGYVATPEKKLEVATPQPQMQTPRRRVPPGGFSSPLW